MKIVTYNVNGLRSALNKGLLEWLAEQRPDVVCLQETKAQPEQIPADTFESLGYQAYYHSARKKGYSGVAILSRQTPDRVVAGMGIEAYDNEGGFYGPITAISPSSASITRRGLRAKSDKPLKWSGSRIFIAM